ncbi:MAG: hypothetical protein ACO2PQ_00735 [Thermoflexus sp.]
MVQVVVRVVRVVVIRVVVRVVQVVRVVVIRVMVGPIRDWVDHEHLDGSIVALSGLGLRIPWRLRR